MQEKTEKTEAEIRTLLGEDYDGFVAFKAAKDKKAKANEAKANATAMVTEGGKYFDRYNTLSEQLEAIWQKALAEARKEAGIVEDESAAPTA